MNLISGTVQASIATTVTNAVAINNSLGNVAVTFGGSTPLTFSGTTTLTGVSPITVTNSAGTTFSGQIVDGGGGGLNITAASTGILALTNPTGANSNSFGGGTTLSGGSLLLGSSTALGCP